MARRRHDRMHLPRLTPTGEPRSGGAPPTPKGNIMRGALVPGLLVLAILVLAIIVAVG